MVRVATDEREVTGEAGPPLARLPPQAAETSRRSDSKASLVLILVRLLGLATGVRPFPVSDGFQHI
jgi:hypothetical protein